MDIITRLKIPQLYKVLMPDGTLRKLYKWIITTPKGVLSIVIHLQYSVVLHIAGL